MTGVEHRHEDLQALSRVLVRARWVAAACIPPAVLACRVAGLWLDVWGMASVLGILILANLVISSHERRRLGPGLDPDLRTLRLERQVRLQVAADVTALSLAFYFMGGIENAIPFLGAFQVALVATHLGAREARKVVWGILTGTGVIVLLETRNSLYHWHLMNDWRWGVHTEPGYVLVYLVILAACLGLVVWAASSRRAPAA